LVGYSRLLIRSFTSSPRRAVWFRFGSVGSRGRNWGRCQ